MTTQPNSQPTSYAAVTQIDTFPKKDQAIVLDAIDNIQLKEYTEAISKVLKPTFIRFVSRIANNRICIYLSTKEIADKLIDNQKSININGHTITIRPLITRNKRIVISNVCPVIPHQVIEKKLEELNITLQSPITFLRAGFSEPGFNHILSFRRQMYISPDDLVKLPDSIQLTFEDTNYWLYFSSDSMICFLCKKIGHIVKNCPESSIQNEILNTINQVPTITQTETFLPNKPNLKHPHPPSSESPSSVTKPPKIVTDLNLLAEAEYNNNMSEDGSSFSDASSIDIAKNTRKKIKTSSLNSETEDC